MNSRIIALVVVHAWVTAAAMPAAASFLDAPHDLAHRIDCVDCHAYPFDGWPGLVVPPPSIDATSRNFICLRCHGSGGDAPTVGLHSHLAMGAASGIVDWTTQCVDCHDPHFQAQKDHFRTSPGALFLVTGTVSQLTAGSDPENPTTNVIYTAATSNPLWPPASWGAKTAAGRGLIFVADVSAPDSSREVVAADGASITVSGTLDTNRVGTTFGLLYGQFVRQAIAVGDEVRPVKFFDPHGGFVDTGNPQKPAGVCQVCHSRTGYWTYAGGVSAHNAQERCSECHEHISGMAAPEGSGCLGCHGTGKDNGDQLPPGGRRAVAGEFPADNSHAHYGLSLDDGACLVCHDQTTHRDGYVDLIDPDGGPGYRFVRAGDFTGDPDLSNFCGNCHDADGARRLASPADPFGGGNAPPDVASNFKGTLQWHEWYGDYCFGYEGSNRPVNSHHDISDEDQRFSGAKLECLNCHGAHNAAASQPVADPFDTVVPWNGTINGFCLACHNGGSGAGAPGYPAGVRGPVLTAHGAAGPVNTPGSTCGTGLVYDCADHCVDENTLADLLGNGFCDEGTGLSLRCQAFGNDGGDCPSALGGIDSCAYDSTPWWVGYRWSNEAHGGDSKRDWPGYAQSPPAPSYELDCIACHDAHGSYSAANPAGNPYLIRDLVDGTPYVDDGSLDGTLYPGPNWVHGTAGPVAMTVSAAGPDLSRLCVRCHADWANPGNFYHGMCTACLTCHSHGADFGGYDWGGGGNDIRCP
ncbi:MAG: hypothetical protein AB1568_01205 [Thermodesulfobacteriota bacterium]